MSAIIHQMRPLREGYLSNMQRQEGVRELINDVYVVRVEQIEASDSGALRLTIQRRDGQEVRSRADLQWIKTQVAGENADAVELFFAETAPQQTQLIVLPSRKTPLHSALIALNGARPTTRSAARKKAERDSFAFTF